MDRRYALTTAAAGYWRQVRAAGRLKRSAPEASSRELASGALPLLAALLESERESGIQIVL